MSTISTYKLTIYKVVDKDLIREDIPFGKAVESSFIKKKEEKTMLALVNCDFNLEMFNPGHLTIELSLKREAVSGNVLPDAWSYTQAEVQDAFIGSNVMLEYGYDNSNGVSKLAKVASDFFIYDVDTVTSSSDQNSMNIILDVYSMDKLLDMQAMTKAYTAQKLSEIIEGQVKEVNEAFAAKSNKMKRLSIDTQNNLNVIRHTYKKIESVTQNGIKIPKEIISHIELIMPYLVQYNETFYSFMRRVCARSGEFLYWENGKLHYGLVPLPEVNIGSKDNGYKSVRSKANKSEFNVFKVTDWHRNSHEKNAEKNCPKGDYIYERQIGNDDFLKELSVVQKPGSIVSYLLTGKLFTKGFATAYADIDKDEPFKLIFGLLRHVTSGTHYENIFINMGVEAGWKTPFSKMKMSRGADIGTYNTNMLPANAAFKDTNSNYNYDETEQKDAGKIAHFSTVDSVAKQTDNLDSVNLGQLTESVYSQIKASATAAASKVLIIDLDNNATELKLGSVVTIPGQGSEQYIITHISGTITQGNDNRMQCHRVAHAMPKSKYSDSCSLWLPAPIEDEVVKSQGPMTGFVTETADPYGQGRVRVRMSWQGTSNKDATPWVRVASPMAGKSGNMLVQPGIGDEVLVDFENGNMERPYVRGSLLNAISKTKYTSTPPKIDHPSTLLRTFQTGRGSGLFLEDESWAMSDWIKLISPQVGGSMTMLPSLTDDKVQKQSVGAKVQLKDYYGFYNISMSSKERKVSIASPMGNISLSAFTGISISAPNGDITISGKNVSIKAGDKLTLSSGGNILSKKRKRTGGGWTVFILGEIALTAFREIVGPKALDLSLVRNVFDIFARPQNGTLQVHSGRHLVLEAGKGKAEIPYDSIKADASVKLKNAVNAGYPYFLVRQLYESVLKVDNYYAKSLIDSYNAIVDFKAKYTREDIDDIDNNIRTSKAKEDAFDKLTIPDSVKLSHKKCAQIIKDLISKNGDGKWVYDEKNIQGCYQELCPIPDRKDYSLFERWFKKVNEFAELICKYKNLLCVKNNDFDEAIDAIIKLKSVKLIDREATIGKAFKEIKDAISDYKKEGYILAYTDGDKVVEIPEITADNISDKLKRASRVSVDKQQPTAELSYIFIKCLIKAKVISYIGTQDPLPDGSYEKSIDISETKLNELVGEGNPEPNWDTFISHLVPYFIEKPKDDAMDNLMQHVSGFIEKEVDYDNLMALNRLVSLNERDMWDATNNPGSIVMSAGKGTKTTRLEANGDFLSHSNPSVKMLIESFKNAKDKDVDPDLIVGDLFD